MLKIAYREGSPPAATRPCEARWRLAGDGGGRLPRLGRGGLKGSMQHFTEKEKWMQDVKGGVNLDHFGGAKVDQLVKG